LIEPSIRPAANCAVQTRIASKTVKPRGSAGVGCKLAALLVADALQLKLSDILAVTRGSPESARARQAAMYLAHVALGISLTAIGRFFARDHSTVAHGCRCVEDRRDDPGFDTLIAELALAARIALHLDCEVTA
jgi:chromosomal replication initiation ATPase DnaA